jgi:hypothetical protein
MTEATEINGQTPASNPALSLWSLALSSEQEHAFARDRNTQAAYLNWDRANSVAVGGVLLAYGWFIFSRGHVNIVGLGPAWLLSLAMFSAHYAYAWLGSASSQSKRRGRFMGSIAVVRVVSPFLRYISRCNSQLPYHFAVEFVPLKSYLIVACLDTWTNMCSSVASMLSLRHQLMYTAARLAVDLGMMVPAVSDIINANAPVAEVSLAACPWIHAFLSAATPTMSFHSSRAICNANHATYNVAATTIIFGHLVPLLVCYWFELRLKLQFLAGSPGRHRQARQHLLLEPDMMPLLFMVQLATGMALASQLAVHLALAPPGCWHSCGGRSAA